MRACRWFRTGNSRAALIFEFSTEPALAGLQGIRGADRNLPGVSDRRNCKFFVMRVFPNWVALLGHCLDNRLKRKMLSENPAVLTGSVMARKGYSLRK